MIKDDVRDELRNRELEFNNWSPNQKIKFCFGGDGTLLNNIDNIYFSSFCGVYAESHINLIPIRDYGKCVDHKKLFNKIRTLNNKEMLSYVQLHRRYVPFLKYDFVSDTNEHRDFKYAASEFVIKSANMTQCLRINVSVNNVKIYKNVICDGVIVATDCIGSHGYFKSITRTIFKNGMGFAFINPTYGLTNCILNKDDIIRIDFERTARVVIVSDTKQSEEIFTTQNSIVIKCLDSKIPIVGYNDFMCYQCRQNRNSTVAINDQYI